MPSDRRESDNGAAVVEFAILAPLLVMLLFGIVSAGLAFNNSLSLAHSAREAARNAATLPVSNFTGIPGVDPIDGWLAAVVSQAIEDADGSLDDGVPGRSICVAFVHPNGTLADDTTRSLTRDAAGVDIYANSDCFADTRPAGERRVQVLVAREVEINVILWSTDITIDEQGVSRYEAAFGV